MVTTRKFSEFIDGGDIDTSDITVGLRAPGNTQFNNPWVFLPPGTTAERPVPALDNYYKLRVNTDLSVYEYYDPISMTWVELSAGGGGSVNPGLMNDIAFYPANGTTLSPINSAINAVLASNGSGVPAMVTTLPIGLTIPGATITGSTAALLSGSVVAAPVAGSDLVNKTYADGLYTASVHSITGTTNQVIVSSPTGDVTLSLPQDIATGSSPTFSALTLSSSTDHGIMLGNAASPLISIPPISTSGIPVISQGLSADPTYGTAVVAGGGTGNTTFTAYSVICAGTTATGAFQNVSGVGSANQVLVSNGAGTLPSWQSVPGVVPAALTRVDDTNITLTLGGTPSTSLLQAVSLTLGWTGLLAIARGGTGVGSVTTSPTATAFAGWDTNSNLSANNFLEGFATTATAAATTTLTVASKHIQEFTGSTTQTVTLPVTSTLVTGFPFYIINNSSGVVTVNSSGGNVIQAMAANTSLILTCVSTSGTTAASWNGSYIADAGSGTVTSVATGTGLQGGTITTTGTVNMDIKNMVSGRLTLTSGVPVTTTDVTAATTIYYTPYLGNDLAVYSGSGNLWTYLQPAEISIAVPATTNQMYDIFVYDNAGTATLELTAWTNDTTRATALTYQNGVLVKSGTPTRRYLGSFRTTGVSGQTEDSSNRKRYLFNYYNRVIRNIGRTETTGSWAYNSTTLRQANGSATNQIELVVGVSEDPVSAEVVCMYNSSGASNGKVAIGINSTTVATSVINTAIFPSNVSAVLPLYAFLETYLAVGYSYISWLEASTATGTNSFYGSGTINGDSYTCGIVGRMRM